jgi:hypothetical protein
LNINSYILVPSFVEEIIYRLAQGETVGQVQQSFKERGEEVDLCDFVRELVNLNYIERINDYQIDSLQLTEAGGFSFPFIQQKHARWIFNKKVGVIWLIIVLLGVVITFSGNAGSIIPTYQSFFWHPILLIVVLGSFVFDIITGITHEFCHFLAARACGNSFSSISLSRRLFHLVYQTKVRNIWSLSKKQRYLVYLSGMMYDLFLLSLFTIISLLSKDKSILIYNFSRFAILFLGFGILFEFRFYMKTDFYFFLADWLDYPTLYEDAFQLVIHLFKRNFQAFLETSLIVPIFALFMVLACSIDIWLTLAYLLPSLYQTITTVFHSFRDGDMLLIIANTLSAILFFLELGLVIFFLVRDVLQKRKSFF